VNSEWVDISYITQYGYCTPKCGYSVSCC